MTEAKPDLKKDPLHGVKLEQILNELVAEYGWSGLHQRIAVNCFRSDPSIKSSLKFLRKTPWARQKTEALYLKMKGYSASKRATKTEAVRDAEVRRTLKANRETKPVAGADPWAAARKNLSGGTDNN